MSQERFEPLSNISEERVNFYGVQAEALLYEYGRIFKEFVKGHENLVKIGNRRLKTLQATGYNVILSEENMHLASTDRLIFYPNSIGNPRHFGLLLAEMEDNGIIGPSYVNFGARGSKFFYGGWNYNPTDSTIETILQKNSSGETATIFTQDLVETVVTLKAEDDDHAVQIASFLLERTGWEVPDIRATARLRDAFSEIGFQEVKANIYNDGEETARLIIMRQKTGPRGFRKIPVEANESFVTYIVSHGVQP